MNPMPAKQSRQNDETTRRALTKIIVKLRSIDLEDEANQLEQEARRLPAEHGCSVSFGPFSAD